MAAIQQAPNPRASLLSGLRTGGVRSASGSLANIPHTAAPGGGFQIPRFTSNAQYYPEEDEHGITEMHSQLFSNNGANRPLTAAVDGPNNRFSQQQSRMNANTPAFVPGFNTAVQTSVNHAQAQAQAQAMQDMQMLQMELLRLQVCDSLYRYRTDQIKSTCKKNAQAQQYQDVQANNYLAELFRQQMTQTQQLQQNRRATTGFNPPATAGPLNNSFDLRSATLSAQARRANQAEMLRAQLGVGHGDEQVPMTAALGGKFGSRSSSTGGYVDDQTPPPTPSFTTVISGGTSLGNAPATTNANATNNGTLSKSDSAVSWRRGGNNNSVLSGNRSATMGSPTVRITPPPTDSESPPGLGITKTRPLPLRFNVAASQPMPVVAIDTSVDGVEAVEVELPHSSGSSSKSSLSPTTPPSASNEVPLSPREEASKKLYEGLGIGRPAPVAVAAPALQAVSYRMASQPMRQPRGPPSGADELGPKNFATRIRRKAIGGLGVLMGARERKGIEAF